MEKGGMGMGREGWEWGGGVGRLRESREMGGRTRLGYLFRGPRVPSYATGRLLSVSESDPNTCFWEASRPRDVDLASKGLMSRVSFSSQSISEVWFLGLGANAPLLFPSSPPLTYPSPRLKGRSPPLPSPPPLPLPPVLPPVFP